MISHPLAERSRLAGGPKRPWGRSPSRRQMSVHRRFESQPANGLDAPRVPDGLVTVSMLPEATSAQ